MSAELARLHAIIDALESDPSWMWPAMDRNMTRKEDEEEVISESLSA